MQRDGFSEVAAPHIFERTDLDDAGIVNENIDRAVAIHHRLDRA